MLGRNKKQPGQAITPKLLNANRWTAWARSIASRHSRLTARRDSLAFTVLRLRKPLNMVRERWSFTTRLVQPRIHLAINAVLKLAHWRHPHEEKHFLPRPESAGSIPTTTQRGLSFLAPLQAVSHARKQGRERVAGQLSLTSTSPDQSSRARFEEQTPLAPPLTLVFERVNGEKRSTPSSRLEVLVHQHARSIVERVTQQSRRNETMHIGGQALSSSHAEVTQTSVMKTVPAPTRVIEKTLPAAPVTVVESAPWLQDKVSVAGLSIDQITDQVVKQLDHRVIAARERMGRF